MRLTVDQFKELQAQQARKLAAPVPAPVGAATAPVSLVVERAKRAKKNYPEEEIQKQVAQYLDWALPPGFRWLHIPNQRGTRKQWENALLKAMGVKAGAADCLIFTDTGRFIWIELKSNEGSLSKDQRAWRDWCHSIGVPWFLCRSVQDVFEALVFCNIAVKARPQ